MYYQQGDVIIRKIKELPQGLKKIDSKSLQESEVTGHHHHFKPTETNVNIYTQDTQSEQKTITPNMGKYIEVINNDVILYHGKGFELDPAKTLTGDHEAITIPVGVYEIDIVREYDPDANETLRVVD